MSETCVVCGKGKGPVKCEVCGFSDNGSINRQFPIIEEYNNWLETVVKPYNIQWEAKKHEDKLLAHKKLLFWLVFSGIIVGLLSTFFLINPALKVYFFNYLSELIIRKTGIDDGKVGIMIVRSIFTMIAGSILGSIVGGLIGKGKIAFIGTLIGGGIVGGILWGILGILCGTVFGIMFSRLSDWLFHKLLARGQ